MALVIADEAGDDDVVAFKRRLLWLLEYNFQSMERGVISWMVWCIVAALIAHKITRR